MNSRRTGWLDFFYFVILWALFYFIYFKMSSIISVICCVLAGVLLTTPASLFIAYDGSFSVNRAINLSFTINEMSDIFFVFYRLAWAVLPLLGMHFLFRSMKEKTN